MTVTLKLQKHISVKALLVCKSGLRIGGTDSEIGIGSAENPVIKDFRGAPYVPGSSLKGKIRSMLEYKYQRVGDNGSPCKCGLTFKICPICTLFGPHQNTKHGLGPSRLIFRDAFLSEKSMQAWENAKKEGKEFTEIKMENSINRITGVAANQALRQQERVNPGTEFQLNISMRVFDGDDEAKMKDIVQEGLKLLANDTLGGSGTRGYGWVEIKDVEVKDL